MKTLILYASSHGCTEKCANILKDKMNGSVEIINLKKSSKINLVEFNPIIVGGSIHAGKVQGKVKKFCQNNLDTLKNKKLGLFLCCMEEGENANKQFNEAFPDELRNHATAKGLFGGEFNFERMNFIEKAIIKKIAKIEKSISKISEPNIVKFIDDMNKN